MRRFRIRIASGQYMGWCVGTNSIDAGETVRGLPVRREVSLPGTRYYLYEQMHAATEFLQRGAEAARQHLKDLGYDSELVTVEVLGALVGLSLTVRNVEERILRVCKVKFAEPGAHHVQLCFGASDNASDLLVQKKTRRWRSRKRR
jgi:hypothetical protein